MAMRPGRADRSAPTPEMAEGERCRQLWCAVLLDAVEPSGESVKFSIGGFLTDETGAWAHSRSIICEAAGVDPDAFFEAVKRRRQGSLPRPLAKPQSQPAPRRPRRRSYAATLLAAWPAATAMALDEACQRTGLTEHQARAAIAGARQHGHVFVNIGLRAFRRET